MLSAANPPIAVCLSMARAIARSRSLDEIYRIALDALDTGLGASRSAILLFDDDAVMRFVASRGVSESYRQAVEGHSPWSPDASDPEPLVVPDVRVEPSLAAWLPAIQAADIGAMAFIPLVSHGRVIGKFMLYSSLPRTLTPEELQLAELVAAQVAFAVERTRREERARRSEDSARRLAAIVESSGDAIVGKTLDGGITSWNRAAERMFGYAAREVIGRPVRMIIPADRVGEDDVVLARIRAGEQVEMETVRQHKSGALVPISLMVSPIRSADGQIIGASKVARDISARRQAEAERAELHRRLALLVSASASLLDSPETDSVVSATMALAQQLLVADAYAVWTSEPGQTAWRAVRAEGVSDGFAGRVITSYRGEPVSEMPLLLEPLPIPDVQAVPLLQEQLDAYADEGIRSMLVCPMRFGSGRAGTIVFYYRAPRAFRELEVETGQTLANLAAAAITTADLYEEVRTQRNAAEAARRMASLLADATALLSRSLDYEQTLAAVARLVVPEFADWCVIDLVDARGVLQRTAVAHANPGKLELARELHARYPADPQSPGGVHEVIRTRTPVLTPIISAGQLTAHAHDADHLRLLTELAPVSHMCVPMVSASGVSGAITVVQADSGRHYTDRDLAFVQELAARAALAVEHAFSYRRVNEASRLKDEFLATLSHELRTPLNAIMGYAQMLGMGTLSVERQANAIAVLTRNADALKQIIEDVLDVSRITSGKLRLQVRALDLAEIVLNAVATVQPAADARGVTLETSIDPEGAAVSGDPDRLQQVVWNLLSNAVKFTPQGGTVQLRLGRADGAVQIVVRDDGQGIEPAFLPYIFERFRQADSRFTREHGGLGLGLAIVRELTELHGGTVSASSDGPGTGATFTVRFPPLALGRPPAAEPASASPAREEKLRILPRRLAGARILAVDNEDDALELLRLALESAGAEVTTATSAPAALDLLRTGTFDALVTDIGMPRMDGLELIRTVRRILPGPANRIPAAALTAYARSEDRIAALASGFQMHVPKPVDPTELVVAVAALIGR